MITHPLASSFPDLVARVAAMQERVELRESDHVYLRRDGVTMLGTTTLLAAAGFVNKTGHAPEHAHRGRYLHEATLLIDGGDLDESRVRADWRGYVASYKRFLDECAPHWILREFLIADFALGYAGTSDALGIINGGTLAICDFKFGSKARWHGVQLAGYKRPIATTPVLQRELQRFTLYIKADGSRASLEPWTDRRDEQFFLAALTSCRYREIANL